MGTGASTDVGARLAGTSTGMKTAAYVGVKRV